MDAKSLTPANGGLIVLQTTNTEFGTAPDAAVLFGVVLSRGNGVPWLGEGARVAYRADKGAVVTTAPEAHPLLMGGAWGGVGGALVTIIDQRDVLAVLDGAFPAPIDNTPVR